ncbi:hypothetical protein ACJRO7_015586 [Eucalyptus globulus]|uniref:2Fe-2S ferredoxin-type domain-containing protein n=1 Tax=Eucalyptus globulus TaxID=34317 RepID=A0ABD3L9T7_EUCGL
MASLNFASAAAAAAAAAAAMHLRRPDVASNFGNRQKPSKLVRGKRLALSLNSAGSTEPSSAAPEKPEIELEFIGPKPGADGSYPVDKAKAVSGEKLLRNIMNENKIELYATYGKVMNCGGGGSCGTCIVESCVEHYRMIETCPVGLIIDGKDLLNERTNTELQYLKKKPESWRLACQSIVGNKENSGKVVVRRLPQWKK